MNYLIETFLADIRQQFVDFAFEFKEVNFKGLIPTFFAQVQNEEILKGKWMEISRFIASHFQSGLTNEFSVWNIYLFFLIQPGISDELKYAIENDTFSSRKTVITSAQDTDTIIKEHILNNDLIINQTIIPEEVLFLSNPIIWGILSGITPKKKITDDIKNGLDQIIEKIKIQKL